MRLPPSRAGRRSFLRGGLALAGLGLAAACGRLAPPWTPPARVPRVGVLSTWTPEAGAPYLEALRGGLRDLGYVEGRDVALEPRFTAGRIEPLPELAAELARLGVAAIVAQEPNAVRAAAGAGGVPVVMAGGSEVPVERGFVAGLARPGGAVTGVSYGTPELPAKRLQLLRDAAPDLTRVAFIGGEPEPIAANPKVPGLAAAARALGLELELVSLRTEGDFAPRDFGEVFAELARKRVGAVVMDANAPAANGRPRLAELAIRQRLPSIWGSSQYKDAGLLAYGANFLDVWRRAAAPVDKILKGASPAELPVELPTAFDFIVNSRTARAPGLALPASVLRQATEIIQ